MGARSPMLVAVGMYLPFDTTSAIALGGLIKWIVGSGRSPRDRRKRSWRSKIADRLSPPGMIAGEAIMGIILAATFLGGIPSFTRLLTGEDQFTFYSRLGRMVLARGFCGDRVRADSNTLFASSRTSNAPVSHRPTHMGQDASMVEPA